MDQSKSFARSRTADARLQPRTRAAFRRLVNRGWTEAARTRHPAAAIDSFWDVARNVWPRDAKLRDAGLRITHILCSPDLAGRMDDGGVDWDVHGHANANDRANANDHANGQANARDHAATRVTLPDAGKPERGRVWPQCRVAEP